MKQRDLIKLLTKAGFRFDRHGGNHDVYKRVNETVEIPRHAEINERPAGSIIRKYRLSHYAFCQNSGI